MATYPKRGELYLAKLDKLRPILILSVDSLNKYSLDVCVVPITKVKHAEFLLRVPLQAGEGGLKMDSWAKCDQVTTLEQGLLQHPALGVLPAEKFNLVQERVRIALGFV
jgi:mRNA interferase MazF